jgi:murein DD-endopeptidase MepM/ murein hydrolase activator NlpD
MQKALSILVMFICCLGISTAFATGPKILLNKPGYPIVMELDRGDSISFTVMYNGKVISRTITILSVLPHFEPNFWFQNGEQRIYASAEVKVNISGVNVTLLHRPYEMPVECNGIRLYVETIKDWALNADYADMKDVHADVRLSVCAVGQSWGPDDWRFPLEGYRWKANVYLNTWAALVPYNVKYYHRGEDYGAIPDRIKVVSPFDGHVIVSPLPSGDGKSNAIFIANKDSIVVRISHMNIETISSLAQVGSEVKAGDQLAKTGMTWDGRKSQINDPHCHVEIQYGNMKLASYPFLMEAYLRSYPDPVVAVAGAYQYSIQGKEVLLDGSRSLGRSGNGIQSCQWKLHDNTLVDSVRFHLKYEKPGLYTEELMVVGMDGAVDRDFVQIRVFDSTKGKNLAYGWAYHNPLRGIVQGSPVMFWNRLVNTSGPVVINFGDGAPAECVEKEISHIYRSAGRYVVSLTSVGPFGEPVTVKMEIVVDAAK